MAWNPQGGGPWGGGGGGGQGPWGRPSGSGGGGRGPQPPDIEDLLRRGQDRFRRMVPGGGMLGGRGLVLIALLALAVWMATGFYRVQPGEQGVELLFGRFVKVTTPGLNYWFPAPVGEVIRPNTERINAIKIGYRGGDDTNRAKQDVPQESLMLTGDQNIVDLDFQIQWQIKDAAQFLFNIRNPEGTIKAAAESAMREVVGQTPLESTLSQDRQVVQERTQALLQGILDSYGAGVRITEVKMQDTDPPKEVIKAFNDVQAAKQDQERKINEAQAYAKDIVPRARGEAQKMIQDANAYRERLIAEAEGEAKRFLDVYDSYRQNKDLTMLRLYLERMEEVLGKAEKVIIDKQDGGSGVVPYLPLNELRRQGASR